jgi:hypothetical protein
MVYVATKEVAIRKPGRPSPKDDPVGSSQIRLCREAPHEVTFRSDSVGNYRKGFLDEKEF